jgi:hypothetical protein
MMASRESHGLERLAVTAPLPPASDSEPGDSQERQQQELVPIDGGLAAWRLLAAAFVFETLLWGTSSHSLPESV